MAKIKDLKFQEKNANKGSDIGGKAGYGGHFRAVQGFKYIGEK